MPDPIPDEHIITCPACSHEADVADFGRSCTGECTCPECGLAFMDQDEEPDG